MTRDDGLDPRKHARTTDPDTSQAAARRLSDARTQMRRLLAAYLYAGASTCEESAAYAGYQHERATKRVSDLLRDGFIEDTGERRRGTSGRLQMICRITDKGRKALDDRR